MKQCCLNISGVINVTDSALTVSGENLINILKILIQQGIARDEFAGQITIKIENHGESCVYESEKING